MIGHTYRVRLNNDHFDFGFEAGRIARSLVEGHGYANPFNGVSGPTAWLPPLYPLLMAAAFKLFGTYSQGAALFLLICNSVFSAAVAPAVYEIGARCFDAQGLARRSSKHAEPVALWAAWLWAVYPAALQYAIHWFWEMSVSTCLFTWTLVLALRLRGVGDAVPEERRSEKPDMGLWSWVGFGGLWGLVALSNASLLLCLPATVVWILWPQIRGEKGLVRGVAGALVAGLVVAAVMAPWVVRNERVLHAFIPTRSNLGVELEDSMRAETDAFTIGTRLPLWPGDPEFQRFVRVGEVAYSRESGQHAGALMRMYPERLAHRTLDRFLFFWEGTPHAGDKHPMQEYLRNLSYSFLSVCGLLGLWLALSKRVPGAGLLLLAFVFVPLPYYLVTVQARFRHPLEPLIAVLGVYLFRSARWRKGVRH